MLFSVQRFIMKRYEQETNLSKVRFFSDYLSFSSRLPTFFRSPIYTCHLILYLWGWKIVEKGKEKRNVRYYDDIESKEDVLRYFTRKEILLVKAELLSLIVITLHVIGLDLIGLLWPGFLD